MSGIPNALHMRVGDDNEILEAAEDIYQPDNREQAQMLLTDIRYFEHHAEAIAESLGAPHVTFAFFEEGGRLTGYASEEEAPSVRNVLVADSSASLTRFIGALG